jgi:hypothetical protein
MRDIIYYLLIARAYVQARIQKPGLLLFLSLAVVFMCGPMQTQTREG